MKNLLRSAIIITLMTICFFSSCEKIGTTIDIPIQYLGFENLKVGDKFTYSVSYGPSIIIFDGCELQVVPLEESIELEVTKKFGENFTIEAFRYSPSRPSATEEINPFGTKELIGDYNWKKTSDSLIITCDGGCSDILFNAKSRFSLIDERGINLGSEYCDSPTKTPGLYYGTPLEISDQIYDTLNIERFDSGIAFDAPLWTFVYSNERGFVRIVQDSDFYSIYYDRIN